MTTTLAILALFFGLFSAADSKPVDLTIKTDHASAYYSVEVAMDALTQMRGLMNRDSLDANKGMLFVYDEDRRAQFWMKNISFSLDILFVDRCGVIVEIYSNAKPDDPTVITSSVPVRAVLEIPGGASKHAQIRSGDRIEISGEFDVFDPCSKQ